MDATELRAAQAPLKERYRAEPATARIALAAEGRRDGEGIVFTLDQAGGPAAAGLHVATGGTGAEACSGDMLVEAVLACAGVTLLSVATAMGVPVGSVIGRGEAMFDARGTLGVDREAPVGISDLVLRFEVEGGEPEQLEKLATMTERYCVVGQSLAVPPRVVIVRQ